jgi:carbon-monoxide dehydrogenase small subunit
LTGTHLACEHGVCGACTILVDGEPVRGCITFAAALDGRAVKTIEAFADDHLMDIIRQSFSAAHGLQCGFCTPGMLLMARDIILRGRATSPEEIRQELSGNICRCTGYAGIVAAVELAAERAGSEGALR